MLAEADLSTVKIDNLLPGWVKPAGKPARATYTFVRTPKSLRFDDLTIDGGSGGASVKGAIEVDNFGEIVSANFPVFSVSDGDKVALKADRGTDNVLRVTMRGDVYDGRQFVKASLAGDKGKQKQTDLDLDIKIGTVAGHNGETLRGLDLKLSRRGGHIRSFTMASKIGRDTPFTATCGCVRATIIRWSISKPTTPAPCSASPTCIRACSAARSGWRWTRRRKTNSRRSVTCSCARSRYAASRRSIAWCRARPGAAKGSVDFSEMQADFTPLHRQDGDPRRRGARAFGRRHHRRAGRLHQGRSAFARHLRAVLRAEPTCSARFRSSVFSSAAAATKACSASPMRRTGPPSAPRISVNPVTAIAPGLLRKFIPSPGSFDRNFVPPTR